MGIIHSLPPPPPQDHVVLSDYRGFLQHMGPQMERANFGKVLLRDAQLEAPGLPEPADDSIRRLYAQDPFEWHVPEAVRDLWVLIQAPNWGVRMLGLGHFDDSPGRRQEFVGDVGADEAEELLVLVFLDDEDCLDILTIGVEEGEEEAKEKLESDEEEELSINKKQEE